MSSVGLNGNQVVIYNYNYENLYVKKIKELIKEKYSFLFHSVLVHGSLATNEEINFSDFDGLIIVKDNWLKSRELVNFKRDSFKIILEFDPLQHHGWFQLKKSELNNYPNNYLPLSVLKNSKLIFPEVKEMELNIRLNDFIDYKQPLSKILYSLEERISLGWRPRNIFQLKSFLSQVMLIPCLFYSVLNERGIFKRESFEAVRPYFSDEEWMPIKLCTKARMNWEYDLNFIQKKIMKRPEQIFRKLTKKVISPSIDYVRFDYVLNEDFMRSLILFINKVKTQMEL